MASMIDRYLIRYCLGVVDQGSFSAAAASARVTQPTLSAGIAKLEALLGQQLFDRSGRRVRLTEAGTRFVDHARRIEASSPPPNARCRRRRRTG
jgi:DNA-binding transcriptional LysR family regulator